MRLLEQARRQLADGESSALSPESSYALAYQATVAVPLKPLI